MKYELKKIFYSTLCRTAFFAVTVLFSIALFTEIGTVREASVHTSDELMLYKETVKEETDSLSSSFLFQADDTKSLIAEKKYEYYAKIDEPQYLSKTYDLCFSNRNELLLSSMLVLVMFCQCIVREKEERYSAYMDILYENRKGYKVKRFFLIVFTAYIFFCLMMLVKMISGILLFGSQPLTMSLQSVNSLIYSPYSMQISSAIVMMLISSMITLTMTSFVLYVLSRKVPDTRTLTVLASAVLLLMYFISKIPYQSVFVILKLLTWNDFLSHVQNFSAVVIGKHAVMSWAITAGWYVILAASAAVIQQVKQPVHIKNHRDIKRHRKSLFILEMKKMTKAASISVCLLLLAVTGLLLKQQIHGGAEFYYTSYFLNELEGVKSPEKENWIIENEERFRILGEEYAELQSQTYNVSNNARINELETEMIKEAGFLQAAEIYRNSNVFAVNTYSVRKALSQPEIMLLITVQLFLMILLVYQFVTFDHRNKTDTLLDSIPDYHERITNIHHKILMTLMAAVTAADAIHLLRISCIFVNSPYVIIKLLTVSFIILALFAAESIFLKLALRHE